MLLNNIRNYLNPKSYNINSSKNELYINNYQKLNIIKDNYISIIFNDFILNIKGQSFKINKMIDNEILFNGQIESMEYIYK